MLTPLDAYDMQTPQLLPRLVTDEAPKPSRNFFWPFLRAIYRDTDRAECRFRPARRRTMAEVQARKEALKLCPWASDQEDTISWARIERQLNKIGSVPVTEDTLYGEDIAFDFRKEVESEEDELPSLLEDLDLSDDDTEVDNTEGETTTNGATTDDHNCVTNGVTKGVDSTNGATNAATTTNGVESTKAFSKVNRKVFETTSSLAPTIHTNQLVNIESTPFYHSSSLSLPTRPSPQSSSSSLILTTVSRPEVRLDCVKQTVYSVRNAKAENTTRMQDFTALNNSVNSKGQTVFTEKKDDKYYIWATHHSNKANDPEKYWFYVVRATYVGTDGELTAFIFAELTPKSGWVYDADMHYKGHFYIAKIKPISKKKAFDPKTHENPPRADKMIFVTKRPRFLPLLEIHSGQPFISYKDPKLNYYLHWVDWENQKLWQICHIKPFQGPNWNASQTRPIPILFNGGMYLIESSQIIKLYISYKGEVPRLVSMRKWRYDQPLASKAILWADHLDARHVVLHHSEGYHIYDLEKQQHYESSMNKDRPSLWSLVEGKVHKFGYTQSLLDKIEASVARRKLQAGDKVEF